jgi:hypothetical protein
VSQPETLQFGCAESPGPSWRILLCVFLGLLCAVPYFAQAGISEQDGKTIIVGDAPESNIFSFGKTVIIRGSAKGVSSVGGDVIVEGRVEEDVATVGGNIFQKEGSYIGGDVIVIGGTYKSEEKEPFRGAGRKTILVGSYEEELRRLIQNPSEIFAPKFTPVFIAQRLLSILFWFVVSLVLTTLGPGAISRSVARFQLSTLKVLSIGLFSFIAGVIVVITSLKVLPIYLSAIILPMALVSLLLAYVFGRVTLQVSVGKWLQRSVFNGKMNSEPLALLTGSVVWTVFLSVPYLWALSVFILFIASIGLVLTARAANTWQK